MKGNEISKDAVAVKGDPPGIGWIFFLCLVAFLTASAFGIGLQGHLALLRSKAQWEVSVEERDRLKSQLSEFRVKAAEAEALCENVQSNLLLVTVQFSAKRIELAQVEAAREEANTAKKKAEDARLLAEGALTRIKAEADLLTQKVGELQNSTNKLGNTVSILFAKVDGLKETQREAEANLGSVETNVLDAKLVLAGLMERTKTSQTEWGGVSKELADVTPKLTAAQAALSAAVQDKNAAETDLVKIKADIEKFTQDVEAKERLLAKVDTDLIKEQAEYKVACEQADGVRKDSALYEGRRDSAKETIQKLDSEKNQIQSQIDLLNGQLGATKKTVGEIKAELAKVEADLAESIKKRDDVVVREAQSVASVATAQDRLGELRTQEADQLKVGLSLKNDIKKLQDNMRIMNTESTEAGKLKEKSK